MVQWYNYSMIQWYNDTIMNLTILVLRTQCQVPSSKYLEPSTYYPEPRTQYLKFKYNE